MTNVACLALALGVGAAAPAVDVLVLSTGNQGIDELVVTALENAGHVVTLGPQFWQLDADDVIGGCDVLYLQANYNWGFGDMPLAGQQKILDYLALGGGVVTCEWLMWKVGAASELQLLEPALPTTTDAVYVETPTTTYTQVTPDVILNEGLPPKFTVPNSSFGGTETLLTPKPGATVFYASDQAVHGVIGWQTGAGRVLSLSSIAGPLSLQDPSFATLLANAMIWAAGDDVDTCPADCNDDIQLNILDFVCFQQLFQAGDDGADVNGDGVLNILDFVAFQAEFQAGCL